MGAAATGRARPPRPHQTAAGPGGVSSGHGHVPSTARLICTRHAGTEHAGTLTTSHPGHFAPALAFITEAAARRYAFRPAELPECDAYEQVALCSRLLALEALWDASRVRSRWVD